MDILTILSLLKAIPKLGEVIALAKAMPALMDDVNALLLQVENSLDDAAKLAPGVNVSGAKAALEKVRAALQNIEGVLKSVVGG